MYIQQGCCMSGSAHGMQMVTVSRGDAFITLYPSDTLKLSCGVDHAKEAPIIGRQWFSWAPFQDDHYRWIIAPARTFYKSMKVPGAADRTFAGCGTACCTCLSCLAPLPILAVLSRQQSCCWVCRLPRACQLHVLLCGKMFFRKLTLLSLA